MKILLIDNFDSFTFNLKHYLEGMDCVVKVVRSDVYQKSDGAWAEKIVLSPGPGLPKDATGMIKCIHDWIDKKPFLGVCLGMQALVEYTGGSLYNQEVVKHGVQEYIEQTRESKLLQNISHKFQVGLYHSWAVALQENSEWQMDAVSITGIIMAISSKRRPLFGVQFHPESIMTVEGKTILANFLQA